MDLFSQIGYLLSNYGDFFLKGLATTVILALVGTGVGLFLGTFLAFGERIKIKNDAKGLDKAWRYLVKGLCHAYSIIIRGTPMMVQAMIFKYGFQAMGVNWNLILPGVDVFDGWTIAGLIVISLNTTAYMCEDVNSGLNGIDKGQIEGARSLGMSRFQTNMFIALPQALRNSLPTIGNELIINIKDSSVLNVIGVSELYFMSSAAANKGYMTIASYIIVAIIYLLLTLLSTGALKLIERKLDGKEFHFSYFRNRQKGVNA
ncbi:MAG: amino acid ABC transporter permease [Bacilli bacterium]|jgi:putative lysine transport system permease protein|nr:amino acid ABC transporter permease [Bacilli bacterium]MCH4210730.1 amino acid ABC transporter permease [Bacilli bacterium]MCH4228235.1 amino acid ABC transporter permease [Bacilli bacterium]MCH4278013.1 amino acid ABC transporter permease [Bacilli bacterium]